MDKTIIQPKGLSEAVGPFSRAILIGDYLHISGTTATCHISGGIYERYCPPTIEEQTRLTFNNLQKCVDAVGGTMADIYKVVVLLKRLADYKTMNAIRAEYFPKSPPISTCFRADLMREDLLIEIEAVAYVPNAKLR